MFPFEMNTEWLFKKNIVPSLMLKNNKFHSSNKACYADQRVSYLHFTIFKLSNESISFMHERVQLFELTNTYHIYKYINNLDPDPGPVRTSVKVAGFFYGSGRKR